MESKTRQAALCIIRRENSFLVSEVKDPITGTLYHRPPGGGIEEGETPEQAVRRELMEELSVKLSTVRPLGAIDHMWFWKGSDVRERAWLFLAECSDDPRLERGETPELLEADGERVSTHWRALDSSNEHLPRICPASLLEVLCVLLTGP